MMGKISSEDKMRIQALYEQGWGYKRITAAYPEKQWKLGSVKGICKRIAVTGSAAKKKGGSGCSRSVHNQAHIAKVPDLICSQEDQPRTSKSLCKIAAEIGISNDLSLT